MNTIVWMPSSHWLQVSSVWSWHLLDAFHNLSSLCHQSIIISHFYTECLLQLDINQKLFQTPLCHFKNQNHVFSELKEQFIHCCNHLRMMVEGMIHWKLFNTPTVARSPPHITRSNWAASALLEPDLIRTFTLHEERGRQQWVCVQLAVQGKNAGLKWLVFPSFECKWKRNTLLLLLCDAWY